MGDFRRNDTLIRTLHSFFDSSGNEVDQIYNQMVHRLTVPKQLKNGKAITSDNRLNQVTYDYFKQYEYDLNNITPTVTQYIGWLQDTYGRTSLEKFWQKADNGLVGVFNFAIGDDLEALLSPNSSSGQRALAAVTITPWGKALKLIKKGGKLITLGVDLLKGANKIADAEKLLKTTDDIAAYTMRSNTDRLTFDELMGKKASEGARKVCWSMPENVATINGRAYSEHALERMAPNTAEVRAELTTRAYKKAAEKGFQPGTREYNDFVGITPNVVESTIQNGTKTAGNTPGTTVYTSNEVTIVTNTSGKVVTVIPR